MNFYRFMDNSENKGERKCSLRIVQGLNHIRMYRFYGRCWDLTQ